MTHRYPRTVPTGLEGFNRRPVVPLFRVSPDNSTKGNSFKEIATTSRLAGSIRTFPLFCVHVCCLFFRVLFHVLSLFL